MGMIEKYSALWMLLVLALIAVYYIVRAFFASQQVRRDAQSEFEYRKNEKSLELSASSQQYVRAYNRFNNPRREWYLGLSGLIIVLLTPPAILLYEFVFDILWVRSGSPYEYGPGTIVWRFILFFVLIAFWALFFYSVAKFYHKRRPHSFKDELRKEIQKET